MFVSVCKCICVCSMRVFACAMCAMHTLEILWGMHLCVCAVFVCVRCACVCVCVECICLCVCDVHVQQCLARWNRRVCSVLECVLQCVAVC